MSDIESTAREMGWRPKEEFRGDPEKWVPAETWVSRGENFIPLIRADRDRNKQRADALESQLAETKKLLEASQEAIQGLKEFQTEHTREKVKQAKRDVLRQIKEARESGDVEVELRLTEELEDLREAEKQASAPAPAPKPAAAPAAAPAPGVDPSTKSWEDANPWFKESARKRGLALGIAEEIRSDPKTKHLTGKAFFDELDRQLALEPAFGGERRESKVDGGRPTGGTGASSGGSKTYHDLPPDAKAACDRQAKSVVGPGRAFKEAKDWQAYYAKEYFSE